MRFSTFAFLPALALAAPWQDDSSDNYASEDSYAPLDVPTQVTIERSQYSGNGCPQGSVSSLISPDKSVITFGFDKFQAVLGPRSNPSDKQKNCQLHLSLRYPSGFQLSLVTATYHGWVRLDQGITANFISSYYFSQAASKTANSRTTLQGSEFKNGKTYTKEDKIENASTVWSPCGANGILNINNRIALTSNTNNANAEGEISNDDATIKFEQKLRLVWRRCTQDRKKFSDTRDSFQNNNIDSTIDLQ